MHRFPVALIVACALACARPDSPAGAVRAFYAERVRLRIDGVPNADQLAAVAPLVSDTLRALLGAARRLRDAEAARAPDEKPPFVEGDLFSSLFEGPTSFEVDSTATGAVVPVRLVRADDAGRTAWTDRVVAREERGRWVVDDVEYGGRWEMANRGTLRAALSSALVPEPRPMRP